VKRQRIGLLALAAMILPAIFFAAQDETFKEKVSVVNVEIPVRVFHKGEPVTSLTRADFRLSEDKSPLPINGFELRRKKIRAQQITLATEEPGAVLPPRHFVLVFHIFEYTDAIEKAMAYFFANWLRPADHLLVIVNNRTQLLDGPVWQVQRRQILDSLLRQEAQRARQELEKFVLFAQKDLDQSRFFAIMDREADNNPGVVISFLQQSLNNWETFKKRYLLPDLGIFYSFAGYLEKVRAEKWVLMFYQAGAFPHLRLSGPMHQRLENYTSQMSSFGTAPASFADRINRQLDMLDSLNSFFPSEEVGRLLARAGATFHCFTSTLPRETLSEDVDYKLVSGDVVSSLREISARSGGELTSNQDLLSALHAIEEREDFYYMLTYEPPNPKKIGKVKVAVNHPEYKLFYDDNIRSDYIDDYLKKRGASDPAIQLRKLSFAARVLQLEIATFRRAKLDRATAGEQGRIEVALKVLDSSDKAVYDQRRALAVKESPAKLSVSFPWLQSGAYTIIVEVSDLLSGKSAMDALAVSIE